MNIAHSFRRFVRVARLAVLGPAAALCVHCHAAPPSGAPAGRAAPPATSAQPKAADRGGAGKEIVRIDDELTARRIAKDTFVVTHEPFFSSNVLVARMPDGAVLVGSSPFETVASRALVGWIRATMSPTRIVAINTHFHFDGTGGNEAYRELGVDTWASSLTQQLLRDVGPRMQTVSAAQTSHPGRRARVAAMRLVPAEHTFEAGKELEMGFGAERVRIVSPGPAHAPDNVVVWMPARGVVFGGCMIKSSDAAGFIGHADLEHWEEAVETVRALGARVVIPGHGAVGGPELYDLTIRVVRRELAARMRP